MVEPVNDGYRLMRFADRIARGSKSTTLSVIVEQSMVTPPDHPGPVDAAFLLRAYAAVVALPARCRAAVGAIPEDAGEDIDHLLSPLEPVEKAFKSSHLGTNCDQLKRTITPTVVSELRGLGAALARHGGRAAIPDDAELTALVGDVQELFSAFATADLDPALRRFALDQLRRIQNAIAVVRIDGPDGLVRVVDAAMGEVVRDTVSDTPRGLKRWLDDDHDGRRLAALLLQVADLAKVSAPAIGAAVGAVLGAGG